MTVVARFAAASCFVMAAFSWEPAFVDRAGIAALGLAFLSLAVGRAAVGSGSPLPSPFGALRPGQLEAAAAEAETIVGRIGQYGAPGGATAETRGR